MSTLKTFLSLSFGEGLWRRLVLSVALIFTATNVSFSQSYSIVPDDTINMVGIMEDLATLSIEQLNTSPNTIQLSWAKVSESIPVAWETNVCDNFVCYTSLVNSGSMNPVAPNYYGLLLIHVTPHVNYGTAIIRYTVWDIASPALKDTLTYILTVNAPTGISEAVNKNIFNIFPNPARENISIISMLQTGFEFLITDVSGKKVNKGISETNFISVNTANLSQGLYTISILSENKIIHTKQFLIHK